MNNQGELSAPSTSQQDPDALERVKIAQAIREYHHRALWEEEKHFTWLVSIALGALVLLFTAKIGRPEKLLLIGAVALAGALSALIGFRVLRLESVNFQLALQRVVSEHNRCFPAHSLANPPSTATKSIPRLIAAALQSRAGIRDYFELLLLFFSVLFTSILIVALATFAQTWLIWSCQ
ncbi:MAG TPA: hypothetical protein VFE33_09510 [Thermoanaerobaculia bacterium]|nr:hypothetical protein [Thermoanaerobaculia bacterium]